MRAPRGDTVARMAPPRCFIRVEWKVARRHDLPEDRSSESRNFTRAEYAARQIRAVLSWVPSHAEIVGVWTTCGYSGDGVEWTPIEQKRPVDGGPSELDRFVEENLAPHWRARYELLDGSKSGLSP